MPLFFTLDDLRATFRRDVLDRGRTYVQSGKVKTLTVDDAGSTIVATVSGTSIYNVRIYCSNTKKSGRLIISGFCSCPYGEYCKHVAATLLAALDRQTAAMRPARTPAPAVPARAMPAPRPKPERRDEDALVDHWLDELRATLPADSEADGTERLAYLFRERVTPSLRGFPIEIHVVRRNKAGKWTKLREMTSDTLISSAARAVASDDALLGRFLGAYAATHGTRGRLATEIASRIVATGRAFLRTTAGEPLSAGPVATARIVWTLSEDGSQRPAIAFDDPELTALPGVPGWYVHERLGQAGPIETGLPIDTLLAILAAPPLDRAQALRVRERIATTLPALAMPTPVMVAERTIRAELVPRLLLRSVEDRIASSYAMRYAHAPPETLDVAELTFAYGEIVVDPSSKERSSRRTVDGETLVTLRKPKAEAAAIARLRATTLLEHKGLRGRIDAKGPLFGYPANEKTSWAIFLGGVAALRAGGWQIDIDPSFRPRLIDATDDVLWSSSIEERDGGWFDLAIGIEHDGKRIDLLRLLSALLERRVPLLGQENLAKVGPDDIWYVHLEPEGTSLALPAHRVRSILEALVELADPAALRADGSVRLPRPRAAIVNELEGAVGARWDVPERVRSLATQLRRAEPHVRTPVPPSFTGVLREYQREGLDWLQFLAAYGMGGILADDMGLGKSVQTLAHLLVQKERGRLDRPVLLVVPTSLVFNWCDEAARFAPSLRVLALHGPERAARFGSIDDHDLVITTYALLVRDEILRGRSWHAVVLDEAQALKNPQSKAAQAAMALRAEHRLCLTGTPVENHLGDLWSLFSIALPGGLGDRRQFVRLFRTPIEKHDDPVRRRALADRIAPFVLRRTKEAVARELPEKSEIVRRVELSGAQRDLYETVRLAMHERVRAEIAARGLARSQIVILDALLKLRQVCCDPRLLKGKLAKNAPSVKFDVLLDMLPEMIEEGRRILVFSQFTSMLRLIEPALAAREIPFAVLTGETKNRGPVVARFQNGDVPVFLISLKAGGTGLNLTAADTVIHFDPWWNPAVERQATDRAHRIGQQRHVFVYKLIGAGTVEEKILDLQARKAEIAAAIFSEGSGPKAALAADDIERLFAPLG